MAFSKSPIEDRGLLERAGLWPLRGAWFLLPVLLGPALSPALERFDSPGSAIAETLLWAGWFGGLVVSGVPSAISLTAIRILAPTTVGLAIIAGLATEATATPQLIGLGFALVVTAMTYLPIVGDRMVNGSAYGSERRMTLRPPGYTLLGPVQVAWLVIFAGAVTGPILIASGRYITGAIAVVLGAGLGWGGWRALHQLSRRWIVFVPAGFVIHDHLLAVESILMRRSTVVALGPAPSPVPDDAFDLTGGARGLSLEVTLTENVDVGARSGPNVDTVDADRIVFTPTLPGALLAEARTRAIAIGVIESR